jgi:predicted double-glycine peptidase
MVELRCLVASLEDTQFIQTVKNEHSFLGGAATRACTVITKCDGKLMPRGVHHLAMRKYESKPSHNDNLLTAN